MVSTGYPNVPRNAHPYQYLKEAYGLSTSPTNLMAPNDNSEWPSLNNAMYGGEDQRNMARRPMNPSMQANQQQMTRRPNSIGRVGMPQMGMQQMNVAQQQFQQQKQVQQAINNGAAKNPKLYKTELCRSYEDTGICNYGERCQFAHGSQERRQLARHPKYKTEYCSSYHKNGLCQYGTRCHFIHNAEEVHGYTPKQPIDQMQQQPIRPNNLFNNTAVSNSPTFGSQRGTPVNLGPIGSNNNYPNNAIARAASLAASAYNKNPDYFSHQFQSQLQIFNDGLKNSPTGNVTPTQTTGFELGGSTGESPIPSSNDSGSESPVCSFSPGSTEVDDPAFFFVRKQLEATKISGPKLQTAALNLLPSSLNSDFESGFSSSSSTSSNVGTKSLNSPIIGSPPCTTWSNGTIGTPTSAGAARLPVFERLSNNL